MARSVIRLAERDVKPFVPHSLLPLLALLGLLLFALIIFSTGTVESTARNEGNAALAEIGADWADLSVSGQFATLEGTAPSLAAKRAAERAVAEATNKTPFFGVSARPVLSVRNNLKVASAPTPATPTETEPAEQYTRHDLSYTLDRTVLELRGEVPDEETKRSILNAANSRVTPPRVTGVRDLLRVTGRTAAPGFTETALRGVNTLSRCNFGVASFVNEVFSLNCEAGAGAIREVETIGNAPLSFGSIGQIEAYGAADIEACNQSFLDLLSTTSVRFATSSAVIDASSSLLLDRVAEAARTCPGSLNISGHTDSSGRALENERLSLRRAEAVRRALVDRGIDANRLRAEGFGANRPIAENTTAQGRARNRRIEINVARGGN